MALLELENLSAGYGPVQAVRNISLTVDAGEIVTLIGANGAGKSTILRTISRLVNPRPGRITFATCAQRDSCNTQDKQFSRMAGHFVPFVRTVSPSDTLSAF